jgi:hypothetical protein
LEIVSTDTNIPSLYLVASNQECILAFAEGEQIECHGKPERDDALVDIVVKTTERFLEGITVLESYNRQEKLIRKEFFFGIDTESDAKCRMGISWYFLIFPKKVCSMRKRTFKFLI